MICHKSPLRYYITKRECDVVLGKFSQRFPKIEMTVGLEQLWWLQVGHDHGDH